MSVDIRCKNCGRKIAEADLTPGSYFTVKCKRCGAINGVIKKSNGEIEVWIVSNGTGKLKNIKPQGVKI